MRLKQLAACYIVRIIQKYGPHTVHVLGKIYIISKDVFNPKIFYTIIFMAKNIKVTPEDEVLDMDIRCKLRRYNLFC